MLELALSIEDATIGFKYALNDIYYMSYALLLIDGLDADDFNGRYSSNEYSRYWDNVTSWKF